MKITANTRVVFTLSVVCALPVEASAAGFVEDASANLNLRNFYINRNFTNPANAQGKAEEWTQNFITCAGATRAFAAITAAMTSTRIA